MSTPAVAVFVLHVAVIAFNVFGLVAIPLGAWRRWAFVRIFWWRALHVLSLGIVLVQAIFGRACFLTLWQDALEGQQESEAAPLIQRWIERIIYWDVPVEVFAVLYGAVFIYVGILWWRVPPRRGF